MTEHTIKIRINEMMTVDLEMPEEVDILTWQGIIDQTKALMRNNVVEMPTTQGRRYVSAQPVDKFRTFDDDEIKVIIKNYNPHISTSQNSRDIAEMLEDRKVQSVYGKIYDLKKKKLIK